MKTKVGDSPHVLALLVEQWRNKSEHWERWSQTNGNPQPSRDGMAFAEAYAECATDLKAALDHLQCVPSTRGPEGV